MLERSTGNKQDSNRAPLRKLDRKESSNNLGDRPGDGTTFTFAIDNNESADFLDKQSKNKNQIVRQFTSSELIDALKGGDNDTMNDQEKISNFIKQLKNGEINNGNKKPSDFRKKRLTYEHQLPKEKSDKNENLLSNKDVSVQDIIKPKKSTIFSSSEIGNKKIKKIKE